MAPFAFSARRLTLVLLLTGLFAASITVTSTMAVWTETESSTGSILAADTFDGNPPEDWLAYDDANGNGRWNYGETTYPAEEIADGFDNETVNLTIPANVNNTGSGVLILEQPVRAHSISSDSDLRARGRGDLIFESMNGNIELNGSVRTFSGDVTINSSKEINLQGSNIQTTIPIPFFSGGSITLESVGDININSTTIDAGEDGFFSNGGDVDADLNVPSATLFVDDASIADQDDTLIYEPGDVSVTGNTSDGNVSAAP